MTYNQAEEEEREGERKGEGREGRGAPFLWERTSWQADKNFLRAASLTLLP